MRHISLVPRTRRLHGRAAPSSRCLTPAETVAIAHIQSQPSIIGYAILRPNGEEIESGGAWKETLAPVFAHLFDLADRIGGDFGEREACPIVMFEGAEFEVAGRRLSSARAVFIRRKRPAMRDVLRLVG